MGVASWGRLETCGGLVTRHQPMARMLEGAGWQPARRIPSCPTIIAALVVAAIAGCSAAFAANPFAPLTGAEIREAVRVIRASGRAPAARFSLIALEEPAKEAVLRNAATPRRAFAVVYNPATHETAEAVVDLAAEKLASWTPKPGAQPPIGAADSEMADHIVRADRAVECGSARARHPRPGGCLLGGLAGRLFRTAGRRTTSGWCELLLIMPARARIFTPTRWREWRRS